MTLACLVMAPEKSISYLKLSPSAKADEQKQGLIAGVKSVRESGSFAPPGPLDFPHATTAYAVAFIPLPLRGKKPLVFSRRAIEIPSYRASLKACAAQKQEPLRLFRKLFSE